MKRSEMLKAIRDELCGKSLDWKTFEYDILDTVEKLGMLPPKHYNVPETEIEEPSMKGYHGLNGWQKE